MSIVELMVGVTIGLIVVAAASLIMSGQLVENRKLLLETQLQQDLRAAADIITRELRRAGSLAESSEAPYVLDTVWWTGSVANKALANPYSGSATYPFGWQTSGTNNGYFTFTYYPSSSGAIVLRSMFGFRLLPVSTAVGTKGVIKTLVPDTSLDGSKQDLTDPRVMDVTHFEIVVEPMSGQAVRMPCARPCPDGTGNCWPLYQVRELRIEIEAKSATDGSIKRAILSRVRLRNDVVKFGSTGSAGNICPV